MTDNSDKVITPTLRRVSPFNNELLKIAAQTKSILSTQDVTRKLSQQLDAELEESVLALMAGGLPISNIEIRYIHSPIVENPITGQANLILKNLKDRAPENYSAPRPYCRRFLESK